MKVDFYIKKAARSTGGDKYETTLIREPKPWVVYFPQSISRVDGVPKEVITIEIVDAGD